MKKERALVGGFAFLFGLLMFGILQIARTYWGPEAVRITAYLQIIFGAYFLFLGLLNTVGKRRTPDFFTLGYAALLKRFMGELTSSSYMQNIYAFWGIAIFNYFLIGSIAIGYGLYRLR